MQRDQTIEGFAFEGGSNKMENLVLTHIISRALIETDSQLEHLGMKHR